MSDCIIKIDRAGRIILYELFSDVMHVLTELPEANIIDAFLRDDGHILGFVLIGGEYREYRKIAGYTFVRGKNAAIFEQITGDALSCAESIALDFARVKKGVIRAYGAYWDANSISQIISTM